jgi:hypothetical protein
LLGEALLRDFAEKGREARIQQIRYRCFDDPVAVDQAFEILPQHPLAACTLADHGWEKGLSGGGQLTHPVEPFECQRVEGLDDESCDRAARLTQNHRDEVVSQTS